jgi:hypothetical protein
MNEDGARLVFIKKESIEKGASAVLHSLFAGGQHGAEKGP